MIVDTSSIVAIFLQEQGYEMLEQKLDEAKEIGIGAPTLVECCIVLSARLGKDARGMMSRFLETKNVVIIPFTDSHFGVAVGAWQKYGKGHHSAALNFGDCLTYAIAKLANMPLLYMGNDFSQTDLISA